MDPIHFKTHSNNNSILNRVKNVATNLVQQVNRANQLDKVVQLSNSISLNNKTATAWFKFRLTKTV
jgi:hypothetical protein